MKILHTVQFYHPSVGGMQEVVRQLSERLVKLGHEVTVATSKHSDRLEDQLNGVRIVDFEIAGDFAVGIFGEVEKYISFLMENQFDIITNFAAVQWATDIALPLLDSITAKKVLVPTGFYSLYMPKYNEYYELMKTWMKKYDMCVFLSNDYRDINFARDNGVERITLIPNGAGEDEFLAESGIDIRKKLGIPKNYFMILHVGSHSGTKGHFEAMSMFYHARLEKAFLVIAGNDMHLGCGDICRKLGQQFNALPETQSKCKHILVPSLSREETLAAYKEADLFLFPSNIECSPIVLFECMASHTPFLSTDVGNAKEIVQWSDAGIILPTVKHSNGMCSIELEPSVKILEETARDIEKRQAMSARGFEAWKKSFTWEKIARDYERLYLSLSAT